MIIEILNFNVTIITNTYICTVQLSGNIALYTLVTRKLDTLNLITLEQLLRDKTLEDTRI